MFKNAGGTFLMGPSSNADAFALDLSGNVGIGTTSPRTKLHVSGLTSDDDPSLGASTAPLFVSNTANSYGLNVGVSSSGDAWLQATISPSYSPSLVYLLMAIFKVILLEVIHIQIIHSLTLMMTKQHLQIMLD